MECLDVRNFSISLILILYSSKSPIFYKCPTLNCQHYITAITKRLIANLLSLQFQNDTEGRKNGCYYCQFSSVRTDQISMNYQFFFFSPTNQSSSNLPVHKSVHDCFTLLRVY